MNIRTALGCAIPLVFLSCRGPVSNDSESSSRLENSAAVNIESEPLEFESYAEELWFPPELGEYVLENLPLEFPRVLKQPTPIYPPLMKELGIEGTARIAFLVMEDGRTDYVQTESATNIYFSEAAEEAVRNWVFIPAMSDAGPTICFMRISIPFSIKWTPNKQQQ